MSKPQYLRRSKSNPAAAEELAVSHFIHDRRGWDPVFESAAVVESGEVLPAGKNVVVDALADIAAAVEDWLDLPCGVAWSFSVEERARSRRLGLERQVRAHGRWAVPYSLPCTGRGLMALPNRALGGSDV